MVGFRAWDFATFGEYATQGLGRRIYSVGFAASRFRVLEFGSLSLGSGFWSLGLRVLGKILASGFLAWTWLFVLRKGALNQKLVTFHLL